MDIERNLGPQPIGELIQRHGLSPTDLVEASQAQLTHKMVSRAVKGRRLTPRAMWKVLDALNQASGELYELDDLFTYAPQASAKPERDEELQVQDTASYVCPNCGETIALELALDHGREDAIEDCPVCCSPNLLHIELEPEGHFRIRAEPS